MNEEFNCSVHHRNGPAVKALKNKNRGWNAKTVPRNQKPLQHPEEAEEATAQQGVPPSVALEAVDKCEKTGNAVRSLCQQIFAESGEVEEQHDILAPFTLEEIVYDSDNPLGSGAYSDVFEIKAFQPMLENTSKLRIMLEAHDELFQKFTMNARSFLTSHVKRKDGSAGVEESRYALKYLKSELMKDPETFITGAEDLALEAQILQSITHPNIIKMRGCSLGGTKGYGTGLNTGFFLVLDKLNETLAQRLGRWERQRRQKSRTKSIIKKLTNLTRSQQEREEKKKSKETNQLEGELSRTVLYRFYN